MILIPARLDSTRLPQKMLKDLSGIPLIIRTAQNAARVDDVVVGCDDPYIFEVCKSYNIKSVLTKKSHSSGTDRCAEACRILGIKAEEIIINIQGDEPFLEPEVIQKLQQLCVTTPFMASLAKKISYQESKDPNIVKVLLDKDNFAIYFSRFAIPYNRGSSNIDYLGHIGVYGFKNENLQEFCALKSEIEEIEKLEQLRALYHRKPIEMAVVETNSFGIDTQEDLHKAMKILASHS